MSKHVSEKESVPGM